MDAERDGHVLLATGATQGEAWALAVRDAQTGRLLLIAAVLAVLIAIGKGVACLLGA